MKTLNMESEICHDSTAKVIFSAVQPHYMQLANAEFKTLFGIFSDKNTFESLLLIELRNHLLHLLKQAAEGWTSRGTALLRTSLGPNTPVKVTVEPIWMPAVGRITSLLIIFSPLQPVPQSAEGHFFQHRLSGDAPPCENPWSPSKLTNPDPLLIRNESTKHSPQTPTTPQPDSPLGGSNYTPTAIAAVAHLRMREAAARLGRSVTTLKAVCRRMGIARWPRAAAVAAAAAADGANSSQGLTSASKGTDIAYARRLFRKYAESRVRGRRRDAGAK
jgi:hypothetical protein